MSTAPRTALDVIYDAGLITTVATQFDLRSPNRTALDKTIARIAEGTFDPVTPLVINLATGVGKTYVMAALIEYLRQCGHRHIMVVTPNLVIQSKTVANFTRDTRKYIGGFDVPPQVYTPGNTRGATKNPSQQPFANIYTGSEVFVFNVQNLLSPKKSTQDTLGNTLEARRAKLRRFSESDGDVYRFLQDLDDLVIIADESHLYGSEAKAFNAALKELAPAATIGLTASAERGDDIVFRYPLYQAITERYVKRPVIVCRSTDYTEYADAEERQLRDGVAVLRAKAAQYLAYIRNNPTVTPVRPVMLVTCSDIEHATEISSLLAGPGYIEDASRVLQVDSQHDDETTRRRLDDIDSPDNTIDAVVSVGKLREGWDARSVAVIVSLRAMASEVLTQQTMGRGLRLPFRTYTGVETIDQLDIIAHKSYVNFLRSEDALKVFGIEDTDRVATPSTSSEQPGATRIDISDNPGATATTVAFTAQTHWPAQPGVPGNISAEETTDHQVATSEQAIVGVVELEDTDSIPAPPVVPQPVTVELNAKFTGQTFLFPSSTMTTQLEPFSLAHIADSEVSSAAERISTEGVVLNRLQVEFDKHVQTARTTSATGGVDKITDGEAIDALTREAASTRTFTPTASNMKILNNRIINKFIEHIGQGSWTEKSLASARSELRGLLNSEKKDFVIKYTSQYPQISPVTLPVRSSYTLPLGVELLEVAEPHELEGSFKRSAHYGPWSGTSLFTAAQFDSLSAEYKLAYMMDVDPQIQWWKRLYPDDKARFAWSGGERFYNPDFVVLDANGNYWIVEAKATSKIDDNEVQDKRSVAENVMRKITGDDRFPDQWGYILVSERDIAAVSTWTGLIDRAPTVTS